MPSALVLQTGGPPVSVSVPTVVAELRHWTNEYFPSGVVLKHAIVLDDASLIMDTRATKVVSLLLMNDPTNCPRDPNVHELPKQFPSSLFFGHLLLVLIIGENAISSFTQNQYNTLIEPDITSLASCLSQTTLGGNTKKQSTRKRKSSPTKPERQPKRRVRCMGDEESDDEVLDIITSNRAYTADDGSIDADPMDVSYGDD